VRGKQPQSTQRPQRKRFSSEGVRKILSALSAFSAVAFERLLERELYRFVRCNYEVVSDLARAK